MADGYVIRVLYACLDPLQKAYSSALSALCNLALALSIDLFLLSKA